MSGQVSVYWGLIFLFAAGGLKPNTPSVGARPWAILRRSAHAMGLPLSAGGANAGATGERGTLMLRASLRTQS